MSEEKQNEEIVVEDVQEENLVENQVDVFGNDLYYNYTVGLH